MFISSDSVIFHGAKYMNIWNSLRIWQIYIYIMDYVYSVHFHAKDMKPVKTYIFIRYRSDEIYIRFPITLDVIPISFLHLFFFLVYISFCLSDQVSVFFAYGCTLQNTRGNGLWSKIWSLTTAILFMKDAN